WRCTQPPIQRCATCPATNGTSSRLTISPSACQDMPPLPPDSSSKPAHNGVMKMPSRLDAEAAHTAAETFPRAIEVNAIDDCTVDGRVHRNSTPRYRLGVTSGASSGRNAQPISGNSTKVLPSTTRCSLQCVTPASTACRDSLAPCRKNSSMIAPSVSQPNAVAHAPRQGSTLDSSTVSSSAQVKRSGRKRRSMRGTGSGERVLQRCGRGKINPASCAPAPSSPLAAATTEAQRPLSLPLSDVAGLLPPHSRTLYITGRTGGAPSVARITPLLSTM